MAREENNRYQSKSDKLTDERNAPKTILVSPSHAHTSEARKTNLPTVALTLSKRGAHRLFNLLNYSQNKVAQRKGQDTLVPEAHHVSTVSEFRKKLASQHNSKVLGADVPSPSLFKTVPILQARLHFEGRNLGIRAPPPFLPGTPNTVKEVNPATVSSPLHASLTSWHKRSIDKWKLKSHPPDLPILQEMSDHFT